MTRPNFHLFFGIYHSVGLTAVMASLIAQSLKRSSRSILSRVGAYLSPIVLAFRFAVYLYPQHCNIGAALVCAWFVLFVRAVRAVPSKYKPVVKSPI